MGDESSLPAGDASRPVQQAIPAASGNAPADGMAPRMTQSEAQAGPKLCWGLIATDVTTA